MNRLLRAEEVAEMLALPKSWVYAASRDGRLPHLKLGRYFRYDREDIERWLADQKAGNNGREERET